jgi:glycerol uptake facilitator-like aquaporin
VVAQVVLSRGEKGSYQSISWGWGIGVMLGVYASGVSGAHMNPAVTFANWYVSITSVPYGTFLTFPSPVSTANFHGVNSPSTS